MTQMIDTQILHGLRSLANAHGNAVFGIGHGFRTIAKGETMPLDVYIVHEGWAAECWNERGEFQGLRITPEGRSWLAELERQHRAYLARK